VTPGETLVLGESALGATTSTPSPATAQGSSLESVEREHVLRVLQDCDWKIKGKHNAAERLGVTPSTLRSKLKKLGLSRPQ
jgi:formate hydrogenlyase transcriptional activator